jgi:hypothetical protein
MKKTLFLLILFFIPLSGFGQIVFEKGYFINNDNIRTECLIKNMDWQYNPAEFQFKMGPNGVAQKATIKNVREFRVYGYPKYVRDSVQIDRPDNNFDDYEWSREPIWRSEVLFLRVVTEGKAVLYAFESKNFKRFFYSVDGFAPRQLVYKIYHKDTYLIEENNLYKQQLWVGMPTENGREAAEKVPYEEKRLAGYFILYNSKYSNNTEADTYTAEKNRTQGPKRDLLNLKISPAVTYSSFSYYNVLTSNTVYFSQSPGYSYGFEIETILPFNKNKWGIFAEPTKTYFKDNIVDNSNKLQIDQIIWELPIGLRYYIFLGKESKIFANILYLASIKNGAITQIWINDNMVFIKNNSYKLGAGIGFNFKIFSLEARYATSNLVLPQSDYQRFSLILGVRFLKIKEE